MVVIPINRYNSEFFHLLIEKLQFLLVTLYHLGIVNIDHIYVSVGETKHNEVTQTHEKEIV